MWEQILRSTAQNFERAGSLRYAVTYRPGEGERINPREVAETMAREWRAAMEGGGSSVSDFVAVGNVEIRVIGADSPILDTEVPVRQRWNRSWQAGGAALPAGAALVHHRAHEPPAGRPAHQRAGAVPQPAHPGGVADPGHPPAGCGGTPLPLRWSGRTSACRTPPSWLRPATTMPVLLCWNSS